MDLLHAAGIAVDLATATASPPPWLTAPAPRDAARSTPTARTLWPGGRQACCPSSPVYREHALALCTRARQALPRPPGAGAVARRPTSSAATTPTATATSARRRSATGCARRYGDLDALNDAWGTAFWSQRYTDFERGPAAARGADLRQPDPAARLPPVLLRRAARQLRRRARRAARGSPPACRSPPTSWSCADIRGMDYWRWAPRGRRRLQRPLPRSPPRTGGHRRAGVQRRPDPRRSPAAGRGCSWSTRRAP